MAVLHLHVLSGGDRLDNLVQWSAMLGSLAGASYVAKLLGASARGQLLAAVVVATIPMGIMQATSTQNDYVVAGWVLGFAAFALLSMRSPARRRYWLLAGACLGLATLTKVTALILAAPLAVWLGLSLLRSLRWSAWRPALAIALTMLAVNTGQFARNTALFGNPLGPAADYLNEVVTAPALASNLLRNVALHLGMPVAAVNQSVEAAVDLIHGWLDLSPDDPRLTWPGAHFAVVYGNNENVAGNPLGLVLAVASLLLLVRLRDRQLAAFGLCLAGAFVLFCGVLKWQPWHSRLQLPLFVLGAAVAGVALSRILSGRSLQLVTATLAFGAVPALMFNQTRPLVSPHSVLIQNRTAQYFNNRPELEMGYVQAAALIRDTHCAAVGILEDVDDWEYPWWMLTAAHSNGITLRAVNVSNISSLETPLFSPCALLDTRGDKAAEITVGSTAYTRVFTANSVSVYLAPGQVAR